MHPLPWTRATCLVGLVAVWFGVPAAASAADSSADYDRSLAAVAEVDGVVVHLAGLAEKRRNRRPAEVQACLDDKVVEARALQKAAGDAHSRMVEALADRKEKAAWDQYRAVMQVQAQARKLRSTAEVCRMLVNVDYDEASAPTPSSGPPTASGATEGGSAPDAPTGSGDAATGEPTAPAAPTPAPPSFAAG